MSSLVLISLSGPHSQGVHGALLVLLGEARMVSMRTLFVHDSISLLVILDMDGLEPIKDVAFEAHKRGIVVDYEVLDKSQINALDDRHKFQHRHIVTLIASTPFIPTELFADVALCLAEHGASVRILHRLSEDQDHHRVVEYSVACDFGVASDQFLDLSRALRGVAALHHSDCALQQSSLRRGRKRLVVFDVQGTLLMSDGPLALARILGREDRMKAVLADPSLQTDDTARVDAIAAVLEGLTRKDVATVCEGLRLTKGAAELCSTLKGRVGYKLAAITTQLSPIADWCKQELGLDIVICNEMEWNANGQCTGRITGPHVTGETKLDRLNMLCQRDGITPHDCIAIGKDGAGFSVPVLEAAGLGISLSPTTLVNASQMTSSANKDLTMLLYLLGFPRSELLREAQTEVHHSMSSAGEDSSIRRRQSQFEDEPVVQSIVTISGKDRVGVMAQLMKVVLSVPRAHIDDLKEAGTDDRMLVVLLLSEPVSCQRAALKELMFTVHSMPALSMRYEDVSLPLGERLRFLRKGSDKPHAVTVLGSQVSFQCIAQMCDTLESHGGTIQESRMLSDHSEPWQCLEIKVSLPDANTASMAELKMQLLNVGTHFGVDIALQPESLLRREKLMVVFDMDSTLITSECIDEMATYAGVGDQIKAITRRAMNGDLDFSQSLRSRVALLEGQPNAIFQHVLDNLTYTPGARLLCRALKQMGYKLAVLSGGFTNIIMQVKKDLDLDYAFANTLEVRGGKLTGKVVGSIVDAQKKADLLHVIAAQEGIAREQVIAIGDGANDLPMLFAAGLGIAFNAKPMVQAKASFRINQRSLIALVYFMGISSQELRQVLESLDDA